MNEDSLLPQDQQEDLEDLSEAGKRYSAVVNQADWTVETLVQQIDKGNIELNPSFQRRETWKEARKSQYIESLILNVPVPQVVLAERKDQRGRFIVIDGKQRLITLKQFCSRDDSFSSFSLRDLTIRTDLNGIDFTRLSTDFLFEEDRNALQNSTIRTAVIRNWADENFLYTVFLRLNTGSVPLSPQELRQALHPGEFLKFVDTYSQESQILHSAMGLQEPDPRMRDAELVIRYYAFRNFLDSYTGNLKPLLDNTAKQFNRTWAQDSSHILAQKDDFEAAIRTSINIFGQSHVFRKWSGNRYERTMNRAVFDVMIYYFVDDEVRESASRSSDELIRRFKDLCMNEDFRSSIEGTTKSIDAIYTRLSMWGEALSSAGVPATLPRLVNNKITRG